MSMRLCEFPECGKPHLSRGYCTGHYKQWAAGKQMAPLRATTNSEESFWKNVDIRGPKDCWEWQGPAKRDGYAFYRINGTRHGVHRHAYLFSVGSIPDGIFIDHMCHNPPCCNPAHLRPATNSQNNHNQSGLSSKNTSGYRNVSWYSDKKKWAAKATVNRKDHFLGLFDTAEEADAVATEWRREHMPFSMLDRVRKVS